VGRFIAVIHQLGIGANLAVVASYKFKEAQNTPLVDGAEYEGGGCCEETLLNVLTETNEALLEVLRFCLLDLPDIEVDEAHGEHVVGKESKLVLAMCVVRDS
jgi:hypothetical protein